MKHIKKIRDFINENQFYISNDLDESFKSLRMKAARYVMEVEGISAHNFSENYDWEVERYEKIYSKFIKNNIDEINRYFEQLDSDLKLMRTRVDF